MKKWDDLLKAGEQYPIIQRLLTNVDYYNVPREDALITAVLHLCEANDRLHREVVALSAVELPRIVILNKLPEGPP